MKLSRLLVVGSSIKTSSSSVVDEMALSILVVGVVTTSERKSNAAGPGEDHAFRGVSGAICEAVCSIVFGFIVAALCNFADVGERRNLDVEFGERKSSDSVKKYLPA